MTREEIKTRIMEIIKKSLKGKLEPGELDDEINTEVLLNLNSIEVIEILVVIENEFEIEMEDENLSVEFLSSFDKITDYVLSKIS